MQGVNIIGTFQGQSGITVAARRLVAALQNQGIPFVLIAESPLSDHSQDPLNSYYRTECVYEINIFCVNVDHYFRFCNLKTKQLMKNHYNISFCFWECSRASKYMRKFLRFFDEIWVATKYVKESLSKDIKVPIYLIPQCVEFETLPASTLKISFGLSDSYTFLFCFDFFSYVQRKNPLAIIQAFQKAFPGKENVQLVIKSNNGHRLQIDFQSLLELCKGDMRIRWIDESMSSQKLYELMNACDCYVSLHRAEGFGLTMAEALLLEKPVIATRYSGNLDFMNEANSFLCDYQMIPVGQSTTPYPAESFWADVNINQAADWMNYVMTHQKESQMRARKGREDILQMHSSEMMNQSISKRIKEIDPDFTSKSYQWKQRKSSLVFYAYFAERLVKHVYRAIF